MDPHLKTYSGRVLTTISTNQKMPQLMIEAGVHIKQRQMKKIQLPKVNLTKVKVILIRAVKVMQVLMIKIKMILI